MKPVTIIVASFALLHAAEPAARRVREIPLKGTSALTHVSAAFELPDGRLVLTNASQPSVLLLDTATGTMIPIGAPGGGPERYARPGGLYAGPNGSVLMIDRGQTQAFTIGPEGRLGVARSIVRRGHSMSSSADIDLQRLDSQGMVYLTEQTPGGSKLLRLDPASQAVRPIAELGVPASKLISQSGNLSVRRAYLGSPADGWGVAPDGRVAIVRGNPYRVEWIAPDGATVRGPIIDHDRLPMTEADKREYAATVGRGRASAGSPGESSDEASGSQLLFAETKAPFDPRDIAVSPDSRVWVRRSAPAGAPDIVYDVFDRQGRRVDRILVPGRGRIVGFGRGRIYVRYEREAQVELKAFGVN